ncbi:hypothetical protein Tsubulata_035045 [Turnera subulata]|uniref:Subtilisin-like protease n=1 Tax=Turnera subulata TaxID=218843 RepID=A0A9Q0FE83_9ROSI|nr:hypothetical protein Tsubulata_035045 [Turnera subulata]
MAQILAFVIIALHLLASIVHGSLDQERKTYIVYMGDVKRPAISTVQEHHNLLFSAIGDRDLARKSKIYSYKRSFNGFAARLLPHEVNRLSDEEGVVSVFESRINKLHTTRSWDFLGMTRDVARKPRRESDTIVAMFDSGIYMDSPSFKDGGYGPPPAKWKGKCVTAGNFTGCNNKVIGARFYDLEFINPDEEASPVDTDGHGTHTASTVAGDAVKGASLYGIGRGIARGGVPFGRIAVYKVCWSGGCTDSDILAAYDDAIADGVDIINLSLGGRPRNFLEDPIAIGSFHAMKKGILSSCSAGNEGPYIGTVQNNAPWLMTVAATAMDRQFMTEVKLGNGMTTNGISLNTFTPKKAMYPLISGALASNITKDDYGNASACDPRTLDMNKVRGKIVYCLGTSNQDYTIWKLRGAGVIMSMDEPTDIAFPTLIPGTFIISKIGNEIDKYINTTKDPVGVVYKTRAVNMSAPFVASFSSRGPQKITLNILKPDVAAPGLSILAAYSRLATVTGDSDDRRHPLFNIISGTSMSCPHATAAAAYVKTFHPDWSPAAIKSSLMTTATPMKIKDAEEELGYGAGQINPREAVHPGLVYDTSLSDYIAFLCKEGYNSSLINLLFGTRNKYKCSDFGPAKGTDGLNYPSMHMQLKDVNSSVSAVFYRTVTNVGFGTSVYKASVKSPKGLSIQVIPDTLTFDKLHQKQDFKVVVKGGPMTGETYVLSGLLEWTDSKHSVRSPIVIYRPLMHI